MRSQDYHSEKKLGSLPSQATFQSTSTVESTNIHYFFQFFSNSSQRLQQVHRPSTKTNFAERHLTMRLQLKRLRRQPQKLVSHFDSTLGISIVADNPLGSRKFGHI
jgi:hypothetical protein